MECHIGRELSSSELVHHINEDIYDNRIENLKIISRSEHIKIHQKGKICGKRFQQKYFINPKDILKLYPYKTLKEIAIIYGCSDATIQRIVKKNDLRNKIRCIVCGDFARYRKAELCKKHYFKRYYLDNRGNNDR